MKVNGLGILEINGIIESYDNAASSRPHSTSSTSIQHLIEGGSLLPTAAGKAPPSSVTYLCRPVPARNADPKNNYKSISTRSAQRKETKPS
jgi:hypothetical protein